ncbi:hypothetical protein [Aeromonas veronii]|nr:hypothetical protein [Aeromonas veronii]MBO0505574.1 hypothetical protein [Aeromonas veronii]SIQ21549.1 hypothetical protein SAMN05892873_10545 [Aeromonas veronii]
MKRSMGMVLPMTLIVMTILISISLMIVIRTDALLTEQAYEKNRWAARLKINDAEHRLFLSMLVGDQEPGGFSLGNVYIPVDGEPLQLSNDVIVRVQDQAGILSLRFYDSDKMKRLLSSYQVSDPGGISEHIFMWQDRYSDYGRGALLRSLDELMLIEGVSPQVYNSEYKDGLRDYTALLGSSWVNYASIPDGLLSRNVYDFSPAEIKKIKQYKRDRQWRLLSEFVSKNGLSNEGLELTQSSRYYIYFEYNGYRSRGEYQIRTTSRFPPRRSLWLFPDNERFAIKND